MPRSARSYRTTIHIQHAYPIQEDFQSPARSYVFSPETRPRPQSVRPSRRRQGTEGQQWGGHCPCSTPRSSSLPRSTEQGNRPVTGAPRRRSGGARWPRPSQCRPRRDGLLGGVDVVVERRLVPAPSLAWVVGLLRLYGPSNWLSDGPSASGSFFLWFGREFLCSWRRRSGAE